MDLRADRHEFGNGKHCRPMDKIIGISPENWCFFTRRSEAPGARQVQVSHLREDHAAALARLVPILGCGEEAASLAFDGLARANAADKVASAALRQIAADERIHDGMMHALADVLPAISGEASIRAARRLHIQLGTGGTAIHLARIAALDAAVCTILSRMLRPSVSLAADAFVHGTLSRIHRDEARHVALSRALVLASGTTAQLRDVGAQARGALASVLMLEADAFETLQIDPAALERDVSRLPDGLLCA